MFDVSGENHDSNNASNKQKAMLVDILEKMGYQRTCDQIIDHALLYGELISFTAWKKNYEEYRRPIDFFKNLFSSDVQKLPLILDAIAKGKNFWVDTKKIYDNPYIYHRNTIGTAVLKFTERTRLLQKLLITSITLFQKKKLKR